MMRTGGSRGDMSYDWLDVTTDVKDDRFIVMEREASLASLTDS